MRSAATVNEPTEAMPCFRCTKPPMAILMGSMGHQTAVAAGGHMSPIFTFAQITRNNYGQVS